MNNTKFAILSTIFSCLGGSNQKYSLISIDKIIKLLAHHHGISVKRRWVFQCMQDLLAAGFLTRQQRRGKTADGEVWQKSSIVAFTLKGARFLFAKRVIGAKNLVSQIIKWVNNKIDRRFPDADKVVPGIVEMDTNERTRLADLANGLFNGAD